MHFPGMIDDRDGTILSLLQENSDMPVAEIAARVSLSASACSRRIQKLEADGHIARRVALLDRQVMNLPTTIFVLVKTSQHAVGWLDEFRAAVTAIPEIVEVYRLTGNVDYIMKIVLPNVEHYDVIYKRLVSRIELFEMSAYISMETLKFGTAVPTRYA
jgi:Lrp/AsnC family transcriptional regulator